MKEISVFDVIGPVMIGPSSSHTAGALKIALLAGKLVSGKIVRADFILYGSFAKTYHGHGTDRALIAGTLGFGAADVRIRDSFDWAKKYGLAYSFHTNETDRDVHPNTVDITLENENGVKTFVRGVSVGGGNCRIEKIDGISVDLTGDYTTLLIRQHDTAGVVAYITSCLSDKGVNIAFMRLYRESRGQTAYTVIETDGDIPNDAVEKIRLNPEIQSAMLVKI